MSDLFVYDEEDEFTLPEFFEHFKDKLPLLVIVTGGHYGKTKWEDFNNYQVVRFHEYHAQKRVLVQSSEDIAKKSLEFLSIPVDAKYKYHVIKGREKAEDAQTLSDILKSHSLPILIRFADTYGLPDEARRRDRSMVVFLLTHVYEEYFLHGNCLEEDRIDANKTSCSLCKEISVTQILGHTNKTPDEFQMYLRSLDTFVQDNVIFGPEDCNLALKQYNIKDVEIKGIVNIDEIFGASSAEPPPPLPERTRFPPPLPERMPLRAQECDDTDSSRDVSCECLSQPTNNKSNTIKHKLPSKLVKSIELPIQSLKGKFDSVLETFHRKVESRLSREKKRAVVSSEESVYSEVGLRTADDEHVYDALVANRTNVSNMSVTDIGEVLQKLNLDDYVEPFASAQVDGVLLEDFNEEILLQDFKFTETEACALMNFVRYEGFKLS